MEISMTRIPALVLGVVLLVGGGLASASAASVNSTAAPTTVTASSNQAAGMDRSGERYTHALNTLEADGYTGITNLAADGENFDATVWHDGHQIAVTLDPTTGAVRTRG